ncbi:hypothetical protein ElyMa_005622300 [Elysia marginata]|uniref:Uncharacterized protein n=1 Tax=Elysia marginata TaxID=1093978 RepID=A0AAV4F7S3_9GAST|nr:hypothetical protein ElyMa_005622300 [Elysia marginata]
MPFVSSKNLLTNRKQRIQPRNERDLSHLSDIAQNKQQRAQLSAKIREAAEVTAAAAAVVVKAVVVDIGAGTVVAKQVVIVVVVVHVVVEVVVGKML